MKKTSIILPLLLLATILIAPFPASAAPSAGIKPDSVFYFLDTAFEKISLFFTFTPGKKAEKALEYAEERLAEAEESAKENKPKAVEEAMNGYEDKISFATRESREIKDTKKEEKLLNIISENAAKHQEILKNVLEKVPAEAKDAIRKAIEISEKGQKEAMRQFAELKKENTGLKNEIEKLREELKNKNKKVEEERESKKDDILEKLKNEVEELKKQQSQPKIIEKIIEKPVFIEKKTETPKTQVKQKDKQTPNVVTLPNGAIVEMDGKGNVIKTIKEAPAKIKNNNPKVFADSLGSELLKFLNTQVVEQIKSDLDYYKKTISDLKNLVKMQKDIAYKGNQNCLASYNSKIEYAKSDAESQKTAYYESRSGFANSPGIVQNIDSQLERDLQDIEIWKDNCLAKYNVDTSIESRLTKIESSLSSTQIRFNNSNNSVSSSEINSIKNEILSISRALGNSLGVSGSVSLPTIQTQPSSVTCTTDISGFSCRDNFGSNAMRCTQTSPGYFNCSDSNFNNVSCQSGVVPGSIRCSW
ncbi:MAG: hypothetical protein GXP44_00580 [bacterium]|nr:hypothetical protein [bacterium]